MKAGHIILYILCIPPLAFSISLVVFFLHAWYILGEPPGYNQPDPKELGIYSLYYTFISPAFVAAFFSFFAALIAVPVYLISHRKEIYWPPVIFCASSYLIALCVAYSELLEWWLD
jgi:hypothetical protein